MANEDNKCSQLDVENTFDKSTNHIGDMLRNQLDMQVNLYGHDFKNMTIADVANYWLKNNHAMIDEIHEATDALGGQSFIKSAAWKSWKADNKIAQCTKLKELSSADNRELFMEVVDMWHFFMNYMISIGMTERDLYNMYFAKAKENRDRQKKGY